MDISTSQAEGRVPVTIMRPAGRIDASNFQSVFDAAKGLYDENGVRDLLLDLSEVTFISSAGIVGLHRIALLFRGEKVAEEEESGWNAIHALDRDQTSGTQQHVKLLNPTPDVDHTLDLVGFKRYFDIFSDRDAAVAAF
jgi:anti-anti-sigma regulatory factor